MKTRTELLSHCKKLYAKAETMQSYSDCVKYATERFLLADEIAPGILQALQKQSDKPIKAVKQCRYRTGNKHEEQLFVIS